MKSVVLKFSIGVFTCFLFSCNFTKSKTVYDSYLQDESLVLYLPFNGGTDDRSVLGINKEQGNVLFSKDRFGFPNCSAVFKDNSYLSYGDVLDSVISGSKKRFSFSFWIKPMKNKNNVSIISKNSDSNCDENERQFNLKYTKDNLIQFIWIYNNHEYNGYRVFESDKGLSLNEWQNIIITYNGASSGGDGVFRVKLYINGNSVNFKYKEKRGRLGSIEDKKAHFAIGTMVGSQGQVCSNNFFEGKLDDFLIFKRILTENEINYISSFNK